MSNQQQQQQQQQHDNADYAWNTTASVALTLFMTIFAFCAIVSVILWRRRRTFHLEGHTTDEMRVAIKALNYNRTISELRHVKRINRQILAATKQHMMTYHGLGMYNK